MAPLMYQWFVEKTYGINWFRNNGVYDGAPCDIYHSTFVVKQYATTMTADVYLLQSNGALVYINGTAKSDKYGLDLHYFMEVDYYEQHMEVRPTYFIPSAHCTGGVPISAPPASSEAFDKMCYGGESSMGIRAVVSWISILVALAAAMLL